MNVNLKVPEELNDRRKAVKATWRQLLEAGLAAKETKPDPIITDLETKFKTAVSNLTEAWKIIKNSNLA